jgi:hypothetical protein
VLCLALHQPYADLVVRGVKTLETRLWPWPYPPSWLAVYATKTPAMGVEAWARLPGSDDPPRGAIVGLVWVAGCRRMEPGDEAAACIAYEPARYAWPLERPHRFEVPDRTLARGPQKFQRLPRALLLAALRGETYRPPPPGIGPLFD